MNNQKHLAIIGAGYAGLLTALRLEKQNVPGLSITVIDKHNYQLLAFDLYEIATSEEELISVDQLKNSITLPIKNLVRGKKINFIQAEVREIDLKNKALQLSGKKINFDYLVIAAGSVSDDFGIKGAKEFALPLKNLEDALRLRNRFEFSFQAHSMDMTKKNLRFIVAGGGYTGCELTAELLKLKNILCWKYNYPPEKVEILVVEAANALIPGFSKHLSADTYKRLKDLGVNVALSSPISQITQQYVELLSGERLTYDAVAWAVGVKGRGLSTTPAAEADRRSRLAVNEFLQVKNYHEVFALGDAASVLDKQGRPAPASAQDAIDQAMYLSKALPVLIKNQKPQSYSPSKHGFIVSLGGKWAIMDYNGIYLKGFLAYVVRELAHVRYLAKIIGWIKAFFYVWFQYRMFGRND